MTLFDLVSKLSSENINVAVVDGATEQTVIEFKSQGIAGVENELSTRSVKKWSISSSVYNLTITVILEVPN